METTLRLLLMLSRLLAGASRAEPVLPWVGAKRERALVAEALPLVLAATGSAGGAAYLKKGEILVLVAQSGMPADLRNLVERLGSAESSWFVAQRAAESGALVLDRDLRRPEARGFAGALSAAGWEQAAACPLRSGDELLGVLVIAAPSAQEISLEALTALEIGSNALALYLAALSRTRSDLATAETAPITPMDRCSTRETEPDSAAAA